MDTQMIGVLWLIGALALGLLNCFFGYRLFIVTVAIVGLLLGGSLGYSAGAWTGNLLIGLIAATVLGLIGGWASVMAYYAFIFVAGAFAFALASAFVAGLYSANVSVLIPLICGLIGGFLAFWLQRAIIIIATASQGGLAAVLAAAAIITGGGTHAYREMLYRLLEGDLSRAGGIWFYAGSLVWLILVVSGLMTQFKRGKEMYRRRGREIVEA